MVYKATKIVPEKLDQTQRYGIENLIVLNLILWWKHVTCVGENLTNHTLGSSYSYKKKIMHNVCKKYYMEEI